MNETTSETFAATEDPPSTKIQEIHHFLPTLFLAQWIFEIVLSFLVSPFAWERTGGDGQVFVMASVVFGAFFAAGPIYMILKYSQSTWTPYFVAGSQMANSCFLIFLTGGRIETHFHTFASLFILAFYLNWKVLVLASSIAIFDHLFFGFLWPVSLFGTATQSGFRVFEHVSWLLFAGFFLILFCKKIKISHEKHGTVEKSLFHINKKLNLKIFELQKSESLLAQSEARNQRLFQSNIIGNFFGDLSGRIIEANSTFLKLTGFNKADLPISSTKLEILSNRDVGQMVMTGAFGPVEKEIHTPDGKSVSVLIGGALLETQEDRCVCFVLDLTERKRLEDQFLQSQKSQALGRMAGGVAHDFNNLLAVIMGNADLIRLRSKKDDRVFQYADVIFKTSKTGAGLTKQLLAMSRKQPFNKVVTDLNNVCAGLLPVLEHLLGEVHQVKMNLAQSKLRVFMDENQLQQVLLNLVMNAKDAMEAGGAIELATSVSELSREEVRDLPPLKPGKYFSVAVKDTGSGISPEILPHIFEPFFTTKIPEKGTGLGLATVQGIVEQSGGAVEVRSALGAGSTFQIYIPAVNEDKKSESETENADESFSMGWETILLVEDRAEVRRVTSEMLSNLGYQVIEADSAETAFRKIEKYKDPIHLLITDVVMPLTSGVVLAGEMVKKLPEIRVVFISGFTHSHTLPEKLNGKPTQFLSKPFTFAKLGSVVRKSLDWVSK